MRTKPYKTDKWDLSWIYLMLTDLVRESKITHEEYKNLRKSIEETIKC